ncbi:hypothetical protein GPL21_08605 [Bradyrhizobium pachyrhizi]|uniref:Uncharacterized protein n=1 Tax=Bradyrhizobium pachyrhizi TaxID=280333 RepID=A0A844SHV1_9BRAD|nr:hypothetical protein [Bradyrhizobium pachyrhizi]
MPSNSILRPPGASVLIESRNEAQDSCFGAFSSREPVSASLENALPGIRVDASMRAVNCMPTDLLPEI